ncbi:MAG: hypothetical protein NC132_04735 [Corallococcus sp.]|nr:hypothetical protein [Corallococcus sp.]MCM1359693.1 hypothetical protein [Corallococcus sp.]MCM1395402.1 hypothetical protein [Corallococcus sp.]
MKKLAKIFALVMVCALALTALVACSPKPNTDYETAVANLEKANYEVEASKDATEIAAFPGLSQISSMLGAGVEDVDAALNAALESEKEDDIGETLMMIWFKTEDTAKKAYDNYDKLVKAQKDTYEASKAALDAMKDTMGEEAYKSALEALETSKKMMDVINYGVDGKVLWIGTDAAINATK